MSVIEFKDFNVLIDNKSVLDQPVKNKQETYEKPKVISRNDEYTTGNLLDFSYHQNYYNIIGIDLSGQTNTSISQQTNFVGKLEEDDGTAMFLSLKSSKKLF